MRRSGHTAGQRNGRTQDGVGIGRWYAPVGLCPAAGVAVGSPRYRGERLIGRALGAISGGDGVCWENPDRVGRALRIAATVHTL